MSVESLLILDCNFFNVFCSYFSFTKGTDSSRLHPSLNAFSMEVMTNVARQRGNFAIFVEVNQTNGATVRF